MKKSFSKSLVNFLISSQEKMIAFLEKGKKREREERVPLSSEAISIEAMDKQDEGEGITFYSTENSEIARNANKAPARGIDKFGEKDTFDPDEADDHQTNRDRNQNSDLSQRFYTDGMDLDDLNKQN